MSDTYISSGVTSSFLVLDNGDTDYVYAGGTVISTTVNNGGTEILSGGIADASTINNGGVEIIYTGGVASGSVISGGQAVISGGTAIGLTISNGTADGVEVYSGGVLSDSTIDYGTNANISSGGTAIGVTANNAGLEVYNSGTASGSVIVSGGHLDVFSGGVASDVSVFDGSLLNLNGGTASGIVISGPGADALVSSGTASDQLIDFDAREYVYSGGSISNTVIEEGGVLVISGGTATHTTIAPGGAIVAGGIKDTSTMSAVITGGELELLSEGTILFSVAVDGNYAGDVITVTADNYSGSLDAYITVQCFYPGTRIATPEGETEVQDLRAGDIVYTANGPMPVRWLGQSHVHMRFADKLRALPIRVTAGALGDGLPRRDLLLSPAHALLVDGILVEAAALVNGRSIFREHDVPEQFTYYHVELASHELLLVEGVMAESFVDNVDRMHFHNAGERDVPVTPIAEMAYPRAKAQRQLPARMRGRLAS